VWRRDGELELSKILERRTMEIWTIDTISMGAIFVGKSLREFKTGFYIRRWVTGGKC